MKNPFKKEKNTKIVPILITVAAAAAAVAYLFVTDEGTETRTKLTKNLGKGWDSVKDSIPVTQKDINNLKDKLTDTVSSFASNIQQVSKKAVSAVS